jgi:hypothetical protein
MTLGLILTLLVWLLVLWLLARVFGETVLLVFVLLTIAWLWWS